MKKAVLLSLLFAFLSGCMKEYPHKFAHGDCVQMKLDGRQGMVIDTLTYNDGVWVRFAGDTETTDTRLIGRDGQIEKTPYATLYLREFELEACGE